MCGNLCCLYSALLFCYQCFSLTWPFFFVLDKKEREKKIKFQTEPMSVSELWAYRLIWLSTVKTSNCERCSTWRVTWFQGHMHPESNILGIKRLSKKCLIRGKEVLKFHWFRKCHSQNASNEGGAACGHSLSWEISLFSVEMGKLSQFFSLIRKLSNLSPVPPPKKNQEKIGSFIESIWGSGTIQFCSSANLASAFPLLSRYQGHW